MKGVRKTLEFQSKLDEANITLNEQLRSDVAKYMNTHGVTVAIFESLSQGAVTQAVQELLSNQTLFLAGLICPQAVAQVHLAGIPPKAIRFQNEDNGESVVKFACETLKKRLNCDIAIAAHLLKGESEHQVVLAIQMNDENKIKRFKLDGNNHTVINQKVTQSVLMILKQLFSVRDSQEEN